MFLMNRMMLTVIRLVLVCAGVTSGASGAVFQYKETISTSRGERDAFLWIPSKAEGVRGVVMAGMTLMEREFAKDPVIRRACADQQLAIVFLKFGLGAADPQTVLDVFAQKSGYREIAVAPLLFVGHSAGGPQAKDRAVKMHERCFGLVQYRGGGPWWDEDPLPAGIPALMMIGQFDEFGGFMRDESGRETWENSMEGLAKFRAKNPRNLVSIVVEPGAGHFPWSQRNAEYLALFIRKAASARIPDEWPVHRKEPVALKKIDHKQGWLTGLDITKQEAHEPACYGDYAAEKTRTAWHFDREIAEATVEYHKRLGKKDQFIKWNDPYWVDAGTRFFFTEIKWVGDGQTFEVHPVYADTYPTQHNDHGPKWLLAGEPVGHSSAPILVRPVGGPLAANGSNTLRVQFDNLAPATEKARSTFLAYSNGDKQYRYTEQVGMMPRGFDGLKKGKEQTIAFPALPDLRADSNPVKLKATSDAGLPVEYYVAYGPAKAEGGMLKISGVPERASFPIDLEVVAYQFGSGIEPRVQTAEPVARRCQIIKSELVNGEN